MRYSEEKHGSKLVFIAIIIVIIYLAFFNFNIEEAYKFTVENNVNLFKQIFEQ